MGRPSIAAACLLTTLSCSGEIAPVGPMDTARGPGSRPGAGDVNPAGPGPSMSTAAPTGAMTPGGPAVAGGPVPPGDGAFLPARIRRLTSAEYEATTVALLGKAPAAAKTFAPDTRQGDFTVNAAQQVDPVLAAQLQSAAAEGATAGAGRALTGLGCGSGDACALRFITDFATRAFRRPLAADEKTDLLAVFHAGATGGSFKDGIELVMTAVLQSPSFLFLTELGEGPRRGDVVTLGAHEAASVLSYAVTGGPPDRPLLDAAAAGGLGTAAAREAQARRLLTLPGAQAQVQRLVEEWTQIDRLDATGKDPKVYPKFESLRPLMAAETGAFIREVVFADDGTLSRLLGADYTVVEPKLASFYALSAAAVNRRTPLAGSPRRGLLTHASFLSVHASDHESGPVLRGTTILKKLLCTVLPTPSELNIMVVPPAPDPKMTTRQRFELHGRDPACAACHRQIDGIGFALEAFDGMGGHRTMENGKPVDSATELAAPLAGRVSDAAQLIAKLAGSPETRSCFARNLFRFTAGESGPAYEEKFLADVWRRLPEARAGNINELFLALAASELFVTRTVSP